MNFEKKMKKMGMRKLDALTPNPYKKKTHTRPFPIWLKIGLPSLGTALAGVAVLAIVLPQFMGKSGAASSSSQVAMSEAAPETSATPASSSTPMTSTTIVSTPETTQAEETGIAEESFVYGSSSFILVDPLSSSFMPRANYSLPISELEGEYLGEVAYENNPYLFGLGGYKIYRIKGSSSKMSLMVSNGSKAYYYLRTLGSSEYADSTLEDMLSLYGVENLSSIETYKWGKKVSESWTSSVTSYYYGYYDLAYTFNKEESASILSSLSSLSSDRAGYLELAKGDIARNSIGTPMGINYEFAFIDDVDIYIASYCSQLHYLEYGNSALNIKNSEAYEIMDKKIEMDYDPNYDEMEEIK